MRKIIAEGLVLHLTRSWLPLLEPSSPAKDTFTDVNNITGISFHSMLIMSQLQRLTTISLLLTSKNSTS